jgi:hypothetical protein
MMALPPKNYGACPTNPLQSNLDQMGKEEINQRNCLAQEYKRISTLSRDYYEADLTHGNKAGKLNGVQCLEENLEILEKEQLPDRLKAVTDFVKQMEVEDKKFRDDLENNDLIPMRKMYDELYTGNDSSLPSDTMGILTSNNCAATLGDVETVGESFKNGYGKKNKGLMGMFDYLKPIRENAKNFAINRIFIKAKLNKSIQTAGREINEMSVEDILNNRNIASSSKYGKTKSFQAALSDWQANMQSEFQSKINALKELLPEEQLADQILNGSNPSTVIHQMSSWYREKEMVCLGDRVEKGLDQVKAMADTLTLECGRKSSRAAQQLASSIKSIIDNPAISLAEKIRQIEMKESRGSNARLVTCPRNAGVNLNGGQPFSAHLKSFKAKCDNNLALSSYQNINGKSIKDVYSQVSTITQDLMKFKKTARNKLQQALQDELINCKGKEPSSFSNSCDENSINTDSDSFCYTAAINCSKTINSCYKDLRNNIKKREKAMKIHAKRVTANIKAYQQKQEQMYQGLKSLYEQQAKLFKWFFKSNYEMPAALVFEKSSKVVFNEKYQVNLIEGFDIDNPESLIVDLEEKLTKGPDSLLEKMKQQNSDILNVAKERVATVKGNYQKAKDKWAQIINECNTYIGKLDQQNQRINDGIAQQNEDLGKGTSACYMARDLVDNPLDQSKAAALAEALGDSNIQLDYKTHQTYSRLANFGSEKNNAKRIKEICSKKYFTLVNVETDSNPDNDQINSKTGDDIHITDTTLERECKQYIKYRCDQSEGILVRTNTGTDADPKMTSERPYKADCEDTREAIAAMLFDILDKPTEYYSKPPAFANDEFFKLPSRENTEEIACFQTMDQDGRFDGKSPAYFQDRGLGSDGIFFGPTGLGQ